ncbi:SUKH-4 family immunity protein [Saccharothrix sp. ST-888]|uniref:SUKH-4 family immunity protein n=1 Tax=Saccharothrix sp. ST-888 TaxID=1427391 RepID=UPI0005ECAF3E|nr:SUKH-4 family immunity protein [Saccharothrix sp. ST-888]KJK55544.1 hypothetical protein UK12_27980 [Saccharothrix sp. ST-888]
MLVELDWQAVVASQPTGGMLRFRADAASAIWSDPGTARFATEFGVPHSRGLFRILADLAERDPAGPERALVDDIDPLPIDTPHGELRPLGLLFNSFLYVRPADGTIWVSDPDAEEEFELIHQDLSSLAYVVYKVEAERPGPEEDPDPYDWADIEEIIREDTARWDRTPFESGAQFWERFLLSYPMM